MVGMLAIANKPGGYTEEDVEFLEPFVDTCSNLIQAYNAIQENSRLINTLEEKVAERTNALSMANASLEEANLKLKAASAAQLTHFACMSHEIRYVEGSESTPIRGFIFYGLPLTEVFLSFFLVIVAAQHAAELHNRLEQPAARD
jgi:hypothetical protein